MNTLSSADMLANDAAFRGKVRAAATRAAIAICNEAKETPRHGLRVALAGAVLTDPDVWTASLAYGASVQPDISSASSDKDLFDTVAAIWDAYALAYAAGRRLAL